MFFSACILQYHSYKIEENITCELEKHCILDNTYLVKDTSHIFKITYLHITPLITRWDAGPLQGFLQVISIYIQERKRAGASQA